MNPLLQDPPSLNSERVMVHSRQAPCASTRSRSALSAGNMAGVVL